MENPVFFFTEIANQLMNGFQLGGGDIFHKIPANPDVVIFFFTVMILDLMNWFLLSAYSMFFHRWKCRC